MKRILFFIFSSLLFYASSYGQEGIPVYFDYLSDNYYLVHPSMAGIGSGGKIRLVGPGIDRGCAIQHARWGVDAVRIEAAVQALSVFDVGACIRVRFEELVFFVDESTHGYSFGSVLPVRASGLVLRARTFECGHLRRPGRACSAKSSSFAEWCHDSESRSGTIAPSRESTRLQVRRPA